MTPFSAKANTHSQFHRSGFMEINLTDLKDMVNRDPAPGPAHADLYKPACVFLLLFELEEPSLLAIQKKDSKGYPWRNQVALPGGHLDDDDASPLAGAFRELEEETGISRDQVEFLGSLGHFQTINHTDIEVFTGLWNARGPVRHDPNEISRVFKIPLRLLVQTHSEKKFHRRVPDVHDLRYPYEDVVIWGATARIFHHFIETLYPLFETRGWIRPDESTTK
jgi:8-oxo-dGTP pyrophosphatase MutT (NUDIX family)